MTRERERFLLPIHAHDFVEVQYVAEGKGYHYIGEERLLVKKGDLYIIPIGTPHVFRPSSEASKDELIVYNCLFAPAVLDLLTRAYPLPNELRTLLTASHNQAYRAYIDHSHEGRRYMEELLREFNTKQPGYEAAMYGLLTRLLIYLYRSELNRAVTPFAYTQFGSVLTYIEDHYHLPLTLSHIAELLPASPGYIQKLFRRITGQSFTSYMQNLRIKKSMELLSQTNLSIREIAEKVGYRDLKFFHSLFRNKTGTSPLRYRSSIRELTGTQ